MAESGSPPTEGIAPYRPLGRGTLGRRLVVRVAVLVALVAVLLSAATTVAIQQILMNNVEEDLNSAAYELRRELGHEGRTQNLFEPGQSVGTFVIGFVSSGQVYPNAKIDSRRRGDISELPTATADRLHQLPAAGKQQTVNLPELGRYRVVAYPLIIRESGAQGTIVIGVPLAEVDRTLLVLVLAEAGLTLLAIGGSIVASRSVVQRSLRPLNRVAATAQQVSQLPLDRGEVALAVRVPPEDTNPASEVGQVGLAINHMLNNVEDALAARQASEMKVRQFVADASHELRNPLAAIRGYAELTRRSGEEIPPDAKYAMSRVESEAARMSTLVQDLLLLARLDAGPALDLSPTDLTDLMINAVSDARAAGPDYVWALSLPDRPVTAVVDSHRLHQVVSNLLANARTHTPPGTQVQTTLAVEGGHAVITVTDNGPGIPADIKDQVFERFTRADTSRVRVAGSPPGGSTGLGLAIVAAVVEAHRGTVSVDSQPGHTRFVVRLPLGSPAPEPMPESIEAAPGDTDAARTG